jgi:hypothetical protein
MSFTLWLLYPRERNPRYFVDRRLNGPQSQSGDGGEEIYPGPCFCILAMKTIAVTTD